MPDAVLNQWKDHPAQGKEFMDFVKKHHLDVPAGKGQKRGGPGTADAGAGQATPKRAKAEPATEKLTGDMTLEDLAALQTVTHQMQVAGVADGQSIKVSFTSDEKAYLSNSLEDPVIINEGTFLAGYRSGQWGQKGTEGAKGTMGTMVTVGTMGTMGTFPHGSDKECVCGLPPSSLSFLLLP